MALGGPEGGIALACLMFDEVVRQGKCEVAPCGVAFQNDVAGGEARNADEVVVARKRIQESGREGVGWFWGTGGGPVFHGKGAMYGVAVF